MDDQISSRAENSISKHVFNMESRHINNDSYRGKPFYSTFLLCSCGYEAVYDSKSNQILAHKITVIAQFLGIEFVGPNN